MALNAGARPATMPRADNVTAVIRAVPKPTWKLHSIFCPAITISTRDRIATEITRPMEPAVNVRMTLSDMICPRIILGVAPMALRIPISVVLSFTVTIMILDTPMAPARRVPSPTSHIRILTPLNKLSTMANICAVFITNIADLSSGLTRCFLYRA